MRDQKVEALKIIANWNCQAPLNGWCRDQNRTPYEENPLRRWCAPCIARHALEDKLPKRMICIEV